MNRIETTSLTFSKSQLAGLSWGNSNAPTWLALHGWMDNAATFSRIGPMIAGQLGIRIIALDFSGHGHSAHRPPRSEYSMWSYCHDVIDALDELGLAQVTLMGHSLGAGVANILAAIQPERVKALILIDGLLGRLSDPADQVKQLRQGITAQRRLSSRSSHYQDIEQAVEVRVRKSMLPIDKDTARPIVLRNLVGSEQEGYQLRFDRQIMAARPVSFTERQAISIMQGIQCPALLVQGRQGIIPLRDPGQSCRDAIRGLVQVTLDGGHHLHLEPAMANDVANAIVHWSRQQPALLQP